MLASIMTQGEDFQTSLEIFQKCVFTPETFSPPWRGDAIDLLNTPLNFPYSAAEWDALFAAFFNLLADENREIRTRAIREIVSALETEASQRANCEDYQPMPADERTKIILEAIAAQITPDKPDIFEIFGQQFKFLAEKPPYQQLVLAWLEQLAALTDRKAPSDDAILAAQIFFGAYDTSWQEVGEFLLQMLDHPDLIVRACAAYQIGKFCHIAYADPDDFWARYYTEADDRRVIGIPPLAEIMRLIRAKEIERPGIAGAFWDIIPKTSFDAKEWLLDILANLPHREPYIPYFPCNLEFDAHELFSDDAQAIRRLIDMGRIDIAIAAATDEFYKIPSLEPILIEMGCSSEPEIIRMASWHLAYNYHYLHPRGAELGYVELVSDLPEIDLFLLFSRREEIESPYAAVIYPQEKNGKFSRQTAQKWVDKIFPESVRGNLRHDLPPGISDWYQSGYIDYHATDKNRDRDLIDNAIIDYRSHTFWNPKEYL